jgi:hypothetical protein
MEIHAEGVEWDDFHGSCFYGWHCRNWFPNKTYISPPTDAPLVLPAFTIGPKRSVPVIWAFCPDCGEFIEIGQGHSGRYSSRHISEHHSDGGEYWADVLGPMTGHVKFMKRVAHDLYNDKIFWQNPYGPNTREFRFATPEDAEKVCRWHFEEHVVGGLTAKTIRELLRYLRLGEDYPFTCKNEGRDDQYWMPGAGGRVIWSG